jgi:hypothetical protein
MSFQAYLDAAERKTGLTPQQFIDLAAQQNLVTHGELMAWLKTDHGLGTGHANALTRVIRFGPDFEVKHTTGTHRDETGTLRLDGVANR